MSSTVGATPIRIVDKAGTNSFIDPFGRLVTSFPHALDDLINKYELDTRKWGTSLVTGGTITHLPNQSALYVATTTSSGSVAKLRTQIYYQYQSGKAQNIMITGYCSDSGAAGRRVEWGYFDEQNGIIYRLEGTSFSIVRRSFTSGSVSNDVIPQSSWNVDTLLGPGSLNPSGIVLNIAKANIYGITMQWLGVGIVACSISNTLVHVFKNPNKYTSPYTTTAQLPVSVTVENTGSTSAGGFTFICGAVESLGGRILEGESFGAYNATDVSVGASEVPLLAIRVSDLYNGIKNRMQVIPTLFSCNNDASKAGARIILNPTTLVGGSWVAASSRSGVEYNVTATSFTGGSHVTRLFLPNGPGSVSLDIRDLFKSDSNRMHNYAFSGGDVLLIVGNKEASGAAINMRSTITWEEIR